MNSPDGTGFRRDALRAKLLANDPRECVHGIGLYNNPPSRCIRCELVWYRECLANVIGRAASYREMIRKLERELNEQ